MLVIMQDVGGASEDAYLHQDLSYGLAISDREVLYDWYVSTGGPRISATTWYLGSCKIWVETVITKAYSGSFVRNNPDKSFYPGDGFNYSFTYGWSGDPLECQNLTVCPLYSNHVTPGSKQECDLESLKVVQRKASSDGNTMLLSGTADISVDENVSGHYIGLQINAQRWGCYFPEGVPSSCGWLQISTTGGFAPPVTRPNIKIALSHEHIDDADGYRSANLDGTYYLWDAINVVHNPTYQWKKDRVGTLSVKITKLHDLKIEKEFQCMMITCNHALTHMGFLPWSRNYEYGGGHSLYNATQNLDIRKHSIVYLVELYNLGRVIHKVSNSTDAFVVSYEPVFDNHPYLVLQDQDWWSWSNRQAIALDYKGSKGGGADDQPHMHENRRSKINQYVYAGYAHNPINKIPLMEPFLWSEAGSISTRPEQRCTAEEFDPLSLETKKENTAMFVKAGSGKIAFTYPILKTMLEKRYINATIYNTIQSANFAGHTIKNLTSYQYQYPDVKFNNPIKILTYDSTGARTDLPIHVTMVPDESRDARYIHDYTCEKILHDTKNSKLANIIVYDMYGKANEANGSGYLNMKTHLTSIWFPSFYSILASDPISLPIHEGYRALSPYEITITVGDKSRTLNRVVSFLSPFIHVVNLDLDNQLDLTHSNGLVRVSPDEKFGEIEKLIVNGVILEENCTNGCTVTNVEEDLEIEAWNIWGGRAVGYIKKSEEDMRSEPEWDIIMIAAFGMLIGVFLWRFSGQILKYLGFRRV